MTDKKRTPPVGSKGRPPGVKSKRMTPAQWAEAEALWAAGSVTLRDLAEKFGKARETFARHFTEKGIEKGSKAVETAERVKEEVAKTIVDDAAILATRIKETKEDHYKMAAAIGKLTWSEIVKSQKEGKAIAAILPNLKSLDMAMGVLKKVREERWAVLGLDNPETENDADLPDLLISELTASQIEDMNRMQEEQAKNLGLEEIELETVVEEDADDGRGGDL